MMESTSMCVGGCVAEAVEGGGAKGVSEGWVGEVAVTDIHAVPLRR